MIEIEKKFVIDNNKKNQLISGAEFLHKKIFTDTYYDTSDFYLTLKDMWLRLRDNSFELKIPVSISDKGHINQYKELTNEIAIREYLNLQKNSSTDKELEKNGYKPFCILTTTREKYKNGLFVIDIDTVSADNFNYSIAEIELIVRKKSDMNNALNQMSSFMVQNNISESPVRGKVIEYLKQKNSHHYNALLFAGVVKREVLDKT